MTGRDFARRSEAGFLMDRKKTIIVANSRLVDLAGSEITTLELTEAFCNKGWTVSVASFQIGEYMRSRLKELGVQYFDLSVEDAFQPDLSFDLAWIHHNVCAYRILLDKNVVVRKAIFSSLSYFEPLEGPPLSHFRFSRYLVNSDENYKFFVAEYPELKEKVTVLHNSAPSNFWRSNAVKRAHVLSRVAIVSNHVPAELQELAQTLVARHVNVDVYGIAGRWEPVTPELLGKYDAVITIGKTVQYCIASKIPVFCYDRFGGDGWVTLSTFERGRLHNFSGRGGRGKASPARLLAELFDGYPHVVDEVDPLYELGRQYFVLEENIGQILDGLSDEYCLHNFSETNKNINFRTNKIFGKSLEFIESRDSHIQALQAEQLKGQSEIARLNHELQAIRDLWPLRLMRRLGRLRDDRIGPALVQQHDEWSQPGDAVVQPVRLNLRGNRVPVLTTPYTLFVAESVARQLGKAGIETEIIFDKPGAGYSAAPHFVICPYMFRELPAQFVAFQMEQTVSPRWLSPTYLGILEQAWAVLDYSAANLSNLAGAGISQDRMYYAPVSWLSDYRNGMDGRGENKQYDVLFYGEVSNDRRKNFLSRLRQRYDVKVIENLFGDELYRELCKARVVVNIHYYEGALLETTRLNECLSLDCLVISESSVDIAHHPQLRELIDFVDPGDVDEMLARLDYWLADDERRTQKIRTNRERLEQQPNLFEYYFQRFLLATDNIDFEQFCRLAGGNVHLDSDFVYLGAREFLAASEAFDKGGRSPQYFPALRHVHNWVGRGLTYKFLMRKAAERELPLLVVCEGDDLEYPPGWRERLDAVLSYLKAHPHEWDIFCGLNANQRLDARVFSALEWNGLQLVSADKMFSTALNVYNKTAFDLYEKWDEGSGGIDEYIGSWTGLRVLAAYPFLIERKTQESRSDAHAELASALLEAKIAMLLGRDDQVSALRNAVAELDFALSKRDGQISELTKELAERDENVARLNRAIANHDRQMARILKSNSWRLTKPLRFIRRKT